MTRYFRSSALALITLLAAAIPSWATRPADANEVAALDTEYQEAVKKNDVATMGRILHDDFVLILGDGKTYTKADLLAATRSGRVVYEQQDEEPGTQKVRVWRDTAVVTAKLWLKGTNDGVAFDRKLWFSDTYVRTAAGWRYALGQASLPLARCTRPNLPRRAPRES